MTYRLDFSDDLAASIRRTGAGQLDGAAEQLAAPDDPAAAVHDVRKRLKRTRSLLRLAGPAMRARDQRRHDRALRDAGRALSGTRDADVMVETVDALQARFAGHEPAALFAAVRAPLEQRAEAVRASGVDAEAHAGTLRALHDDAWDWEIEAARPRTVVEGLATSYARGRAAFAVADADPSAHNLHEWRKRVKDLYYQLELVEDAWPAVMKALAKEGKALAETLGDDHDLAVLAQHLAEEPELSGRPAADPDRLTELIADRRAELLADARQSARRLYAESPKAFRDRLRTYLRAAAKEAAAA